MPHDAFAGPSWDGLQDLRDILAYGFMRNAFLAGTIVAVMGAVIGYFVVLRRLAFATEALSHGGFAGATAAVVLQQDPFVGLLVFVSLAGVLMGILGDKLRGRDVAIGATLAFSLALGSLFLSLSTRLAGQAVNILFGNILAISPADVRVVTGCACLTLLAVSVMYRPLLFASVDPEVAEARGLPVRGLGVAFMMVLGVAVAIAVQVVGVLLIFALLVLPAASGLQLTSRPPLAIGSAIVIAIACVWLGLLIGFYLPYPPSFFITTLTVLSYLATRRLGPAHVAGGPAVKRRQLSARSSGTPDCQSTPPGRWAIACQWTDRRGR